MTTEQSSVQTVREGALLVVTITRTARGNALHSAAHFELARIFDDFEADPSLRVAIITGEGERSFCAGNDLRVQAEGGAMERPPTGFAGLTKRKNRTKPVIAAVNGVAIGGGFEIVLACDLAFAVPHARFALPEVRRGLVALAGMHLLPRQVGSKTAMAVLLGGKWLTASEALNFGLINEITAENGAMEAAKTWAQRLLLGSPQAIATCIDIVGRSLRMPDVHEALDHDYESLRKLRNSADFAEGPKAFSEGRPPKWSLSEETIQ
jgi:enoyl-CoA hydratase/carnithine racemase